MKLITIFLIVLSFLSIPIFHQITFASSLPTVTILNPIRGNELGHENENLLPGLQKQWEVTHAAGLHATWLWQYSALENKPLIDFAKTHFVGDEQGLFLEIDRNFATKSNVQFKGIGPWYFSNGLLLISYDTAERRKLIDTLFAKFKKTFGYYPKTVGAWWIGADSLTYMQQKYSITGAMKAADQYNLDVYTIWGSPWGVPYIASKENEGIPASLITNSSKVVIMQWAARDPLKAYGPNATDGQFSTQDYEVIGHDTTYFDYLLSAYLKNPLDQMLVGIENSSPKNFSDTSLYVKNIKEIARLQQENKIQVQLAKDYTKEFLQQKNSLAPNHILLTKDFDSNNQSFWYISPNYQLSIQQKNNNVYLVDLRNYANKTPEIFSYLPNSQGNLWEDTPAVVDSATNPSQRIFLGKIDQQLSVSNSNNQTVLKSGNKTIGIFTDNLVKISAPNKSLTYTFVQPVNNLTPFNALLIVFILYGLCFFFLTKNKNQILLFSLSFIPLLIAYPYLQTYPLAFDKKELYLSFLLLLSFKDVHMQIIVFQIFPFLFLLVVHFLSFLSKRNWAFYFSVIFLAVLSFHFPYFPLDKSTYLKIGLLIGSILFFYIATAGFIMWRIKTKQIIIFSLVSIVIFTATLGISLLFSRSIETFTPFEMDSLQVISSQKKPVIYLLPNETPIYKAVRPLIFDSPQFVEKLTATQWTTIKRDAKNNLNLSSTNNNLIAIPRYLGSTIYPEEVAKYHLQKIFDNMEIAIYWKR